MILPLSITLPIILIFYILHKTKPRAVTTLPPGPLPLPLIGNFHQLGRAAEPHIYLHQLSKKYGPVIHMKLASRPLLVISSAKLAKEVLKLQDLAFCSRPNYLGQQKLSYNSSDVAFTPYNEDWKEIRKMTHIHLFSNKRIQSYRPVREEEISRMIALISSSASGEVNLNEVVMATGIHILCGITFGKRLYSEEWSDTKRFLQFLKGFDVLATSFFVSDYFPAFGLVDWISGKMKRAESIFKGMDSFYHERIDEHLESRRVKDVKEVEDMVAVLMKLKSDDESSSSGITLRNIKALLMNMIVASAETTPAAVVWTMTALIKAPKVMKKLQKEIRSLVGEKGKVDEDDLPKLPYLKAVINESLRLYPPVPLLIPRESIETSILDGYEIPPKTLVYVNAYAVGRDPECWENPDEFTPERFLNSGIDYKGQDFGLIPFGSGRRMCPGMSMGYLTTELMVANLVYGFDWELPKGVLAQDVDTDATKGLAVFKKNPLLLVPKKF